MRWSVHGERSIYESEWVKLTLVDVEPPRLGRFEHHVVRCPLPAAGCVVVNEAEEVLLLYRHRFVTDTWGWEVPAGRLEPGESPAEAAAREVLEETGWRLLGAPEPLTTYHPTVGFVDQTFHLLLAHGAVEVGAPEHVEEAERIEWLPADRVRELVRGGEVTCGLSLTALTYAFAFGLLGG